MKANRGETSHKTLVLNVKHKLCVHHLQVSGSDESGNWGQSTSCSPRAEMELFSMAACPLRSHCQFISPREIFARNSIPELEHLGLTEQTHNTPQLFKRCKIRGVCQQGREAQRHGVLLVILCGFCPGCDCGLVRQA